MTRRPISAGLVLSAALMCAGSTASAQAPQTPSPIEYRVLATTKTSTMEKELNAVAEVGFRFVDVMGGETALGGKEVVAIASRTGSAAPRYSYRLLATNRTSTMQKELQAAADGGFEYRGQTVFESMFGGKEVVCILERDRTTPTTAMYEYRLLATSKTSTMEKELQQMGALGYEVVGMTVGQTALGGSELVTITRRRVR